MLYLPLLKVNIYTAKQNILYKKYKNGGMPILEYTTKLSKGGPNSIRSIVPQDVIKLLELELGDSLHWIVNIDEGITVSIEKAEK